MASIDGQVMSLATAPPAPVPRPRVLIVGTALASVCAAMMFFGLLGIYLARRADVINSGETWLPRTANVQLAQPTMVMMTFGLSLVSVVWMWDALRRDDRIHAWMAAALTMLFGLAIVNQVSYMVANLNVSADTEAGLLILALTGFHMLLTLIGIGFLMVVLIRAFFGQYRRIPDGAAAAAMWWIAVAALWPIVWYAIYVTK